MSIETLDSNKDKYPFLKNKSNEIRRQSLKMIFDAQSGHPGSTFSSVEIMVALYYVILNFRPDDPTWPNRDRFILSKGHAIPALYAILADVGFFQKQELTKFRELHSILQGHPCRVRTPGIETSGSLGQGLSIGCGIAYNGKYFSQNPYNVYVLLGDGELDEGQIWEAAMFANHNKLDNITAIIDRNNLQYTGLTESVLSLEPIIPKWKSMGWAVYEVVDGHDIEELVFTFRKTEKNKGKPKVIIAHTIKGKGVSFMENNPDWHGKSPNIKEFECAMKELGLQND